MSTERKILVLGGLLLAGFGMLYGLHYALFIEHQTLDGMGAALTQAFVHAAEHDVLQGHASIDSYARLKYTYVRQVDVHSHWIGLAMLLIGLGVVFNQVSFGPQVRLWLAIALLTGAIVFPLGVLLQTAMKGPVPSALAVIGSAVITTALLIIAWGFARQQTE